MPRTRCGSLGRTRSGLWREIEREKGAESGGNFEKMAVEPAVKKENRDTEREGASLPAARVQARKWDAEREREGETSRSLRWIGTRGGDLNRSESILTIVGPTSG